MANPGYVRLTDGSDGDDGSTWALANATLAGGFTDAAAGDRLWVSDAHAETQATTMTLTSPGTPASPCEVLCGDDAAEPPTSLTTTATISVTAANTINFAGFAYCEGIIFQAGSGSSNGSINWQSGSPYWWKYKNCAFRLVGTSVNARINIGNNATTVDDGLVEWESCAVKFASTSQGIAARTPLRWHGGSVDSSGSAPTALFAAVNSGVQTQEVFVERVDLSHVTGSLVDVSGTSRTRYVFQNCKLGAGVGVTTGTNAGQGGVEVLLTNCDNADTQYRYRKHNYQGDEYHETTVVRTGGASDGTTSFARKITTSANAKFLCPFESEWLHVWCDTLASTTLTVEVVTDNVTLTDGEAWIDVAYQGTSGFPLGVLVSDAKATIIASAANQTTSSVTWTTTGLTTPVKQKLAVTFTPSEKGWALVRVNLAKASTTMYYCPKVDKT